MKIGVFGNNKIQTDLLERFAYLLKSNGFDGKICAWENDLDGLDALVVFGGDGTILHIAGAAARRGIMLIGVNHGRLGFLTEYERGEEELVVDLLRDLEKGCCEILERSFLEISYRGETYFALNEISVQRDYSDPDSQIMQTRVEVNGRQCISFLGDGILFSTPTGSTAYSLSAGGAILSPETPVFMLTPICSFSLNARAIVLPDTDEAVLSVARSRSAVLVDGKVVGNLKDGETIRLKKAAFTAKFPLRGESGFFDKVCKKLK